jgi:hypothetical protein
MGSQIFDYWFDPSRFMLEHYVDGDLVNGDTPVNRVKAAPDNLHVWGEFAQLKLKALLIVNRSGSAGYFFDIGLVIYHCFLLDMF